MRYIIGFLIAILAFLFINIICETNSDNNSDNNQKYYACKYGEICYLKNEARKGCNIEFDSLKECKEYIK